MRGLIGGEEGDCRVVGEEEESEDRGECEEDEGGESDAEEAGIFHGRPLERLSMMMSMVQKNGIRKDFKRRCIFIPCILITIMMMVEQLVLCGYVCTYYAYLSKALKDVLCIYICMIVKWI